MKLLDENRNSTKENPLYISACFENRSDHDTTPHHTKNNKIQYNTHHAYVHDHAHDRHVNPPSSRGRSVHLGCLLYCTKG